MAEVAFPVPLEVIPSPANGECAVIPTSGPAGAVTMGHVPIPCGFPCVNALAPDALPLLFSCEVDMRRIYKAVI